MFNNFIELNEAINKSKFRSSFKLNKDDIEYINKIGLDKIKAHIIDFICKRLKPSLITNDGSQTPYRGHPAFKAMHACACCCRECLYKWHKIEKNKELSQNEINYIVDILYNWILFQYKNASR